MSDREKNIDSSKEQDLRTKTQLEYNERRQKDLQSISQGDEYPIIVEQTQVKHILDAGANIGTTSLFFAQHYPSAFIYAYEPDQSIYSVLKKNTSSVANIHPFNVGLGDRDEDAEFYQCIDSEMSIWGSVKKDVFFNPRKNNINKISHANPQNKVQIVAATNTLVTHKIQGYDIIKIDTEGCEVEILRSLYDSLFTTKVIYVEYHTTLAKSEIQKMLMASHTVYQHRAKQQDLGIFIFVLCDG